jgi:hypothetical protein
VRLYEAAEQAQVQAQLDHHCSVLVVAHLAEQVILAIVTPVVDLVTNFLILEAHAMIQFV